MTENKRFTFLDASKNPYIGSFFCNGVHLTNKEVVDLLNENELKTAYTKLQEEHDLLGRAYLELNDDNAILKQALTRLVEAFDDNISDKSPIRDLIKINQWSFCNESKKFICKLNKKEINYATPACENFDENKELKETLAFRSNQLALMEQLIDDLGSEEMARQMEEILND